MGITVLWDECSLSAEGTNAPLVEPSEGVCLYFISAALSCDDNEALCHILQKEWARLSVEHTAAVMAGRTVHGLAEMPSLFASASSAFPCFEDRKSNSDIVLMGMTRARSFRLHVLPDMGHLYSWEPTDGLRVTCRVHWMVLQPYNFLMPRPHLSQCATVALYSIRLTDAM